MLNGNMAQRRAGIAGDKQAVNSLTISQLNELVNYMLTNRIRSGPRMGLPMIQTVPGTVVPGQVVYMTNYTASPYPRFHIPDHIWNNWAPNQKPDRRDYLLHLLFWRWMNGHQCSLQDDMQISHLVCYRGPNQNLISENFLLLTQEPRKINESRKYCWDTDPGLDFLGKGTCPHHPKCRLVNW